MVGSLLGVACLWVCRGADDAQSVWQRRGSVVGQMHCVNSSSTGRLYIPNGTCPYPLGSACLWVCRGVGDAHCAAVAVAGGRPDAVRQLFSIGR